MTYTKKLKCGALIFTILSLLCMFGPMIWFCAAAFISNTATIYKVALTSTIAIVIIMTAVAALNKWAARCRIWIILLALYFCLNNFLTVILIFAITQIIDELILAPVKHHLWNKYRINREIDKRGA